MLQGPLTRKTEVEGVNAELQYRMEMVAYREKLNLDKPADRVAAETKVFAEDPDLYKRYSSRQTPCVLAQSR